jgi:hypothetical protein
VTQKEEENMKTVMMGLFILAILALRVLAAEPLSVKVSLDPASLYAGDKLTVTASTAPGASCSLTIKFRAAVFQAPTRTANQAGKVIWTPATTGRVPQTADVVVSCALNEEKATATVQLTIR